MKKTLTLNLIVVLMCAFTFKTFAQEGNLTPHDTLANYVNKMGAEVENIKKLKFSGYIQGQYQVADSNGVNSVAGGNFNSNTDKRFALRRCRLKAVYTGAVMQYVFQLDATEKGVTVKDAYGVFSEPWLKTFSLTVGQFNRPFGNEISYSSSMRESPERGRMSQTIFRNERDGGAMITIQAPKTSKWNAIKFDAGMFNGTGAPSAGENASDFDFQKDFISHLSFNKSTKNEKINVQGGVSYYYGGYRMSNKFVYNNYGALDAANTVQGFNVDSAKTNIGKIARREYVGADLQLTADWFLGMTILRGEYIQGAQPGVSSGSTSPIVDPAAPTYMRNFNGAYFYFVQNILQTKHQLIVKYDWYDPNTQVAGDMIGKKVGTKSNNTGVGDIAYNTLGIGWAYKYDANLKFLVYYDMVTNEASQNLTNWHKDKKDNVLTLRVQYKFQQ